MFRKDRKPSKKKRIQALTSDLEEMRFGIVFCTGIFLQKNLFRESFETQKESNELLQQDIVGKSIQRTFFILKSNIFY